MSKASLLLALSALFLVTALTASAESVRPADLSALQPERGFSCFRYPDRLGFVIPQNAETLSFKGVVLPKAISLYEFKAEGNAESIPAQPLATVHEGRISVSALRGKTVFAMLTLPSDKVGDELPYLLPVFQSPLADVLPVERVTHTTGGIFVSPFMSREFVFCCNSPILSFTPKVSLNLQYEPRSTPGDAAITHPPCNLHYTIPNAFTVIVKVPAYAEEHVLSGVFEFMGGFGTGGEVFEVVPTVTKDQHTQYTRVLCNYDVKKQGLILPPKTRKIEITFAKGIWPAGLDLQYRFDYEGGEKVLYIDVVQQVAEVEREHEYSVYTGELKDIVLDEKAGQAFDAKGASFTFAFTLPAFNAPAAEPFSLVTSFKCLDAEAKLIKDIAKAD